MSHNICHLVLADSQPVVRTGLHVVMEGAPDCTVLGEAATYEQARDLCEELQPDIMLLALNLPDADPCTVLSTICSHYPDTKVIVLTDDLSVRTIRDALVLGADGYIHKRDTVDDIVQAVRVVWQGGKWYSDPVLNKLAPVQQDGLEQMETIGFTKRQRDVLRLLAQGTTNQQIALTLSISTRTVRHHLYQIRRKLGLHSRTEVVIWAVEAGFGGDAN